MTIITQRSASSRRHSGRPGSSFRDDDDDGVTGIWNAPSTVSTHPTRSTESMSARLGHWQHNMSAVNNIYNHCTTSTDLSNRQITLGDFTDDHHMGQALTMDVSPYTCAQQPAGRAREWGLQPTSPVESPPYIDDDEKPDYPSFSQHDSAFPMISRPSPNLDHALLDGMGELMELAFRQYLDESWARNSHGGRANSWPPSPDVREHHQLTYNDSHAESKQVHGRVVNDDAYNEIPIRINRAFACPFYRHNPTEHLTCLRCVNMRSVKSLVQHLETTHHPQPPYCPTCNAIFLTTEACHDHVRSRQCRPQPATWSMGLGHREMQNVIDESELDKVPTVLWFNIWSAIFPNEDPPTRPYLSGGLESTLCAVRDFWVSSGRQVVSDFLRHNDLLTTGPLDEQETVTAAYKAVFVRMIDQLIVSSKEPRDTREQGCSLAAQIIVSSHSYSERSN